MGDRSNKLNEKRQEILNFLKDEKITAEEWETFIENYINQKYKQCTLTEETIKKKWYE